jgi:NAD(P)-dependent dehydrogenase (short-subunit alcohol dehydrogenase family)
LRATGGGSHIGRAIALGYAREGARVVIFAGNPEAGVQTAKAILDLAGKAWSYKFDVTEREICREPAAEIDETIGIPLATATASKLLAMGGLARLAGLAPPHHDDTARDRVTGCLGGAQLARGRYGAKDRDLGCDRSSLCGRCHVVHPDRTVDSHQRAIAVATASFDQWRDHVHCQ